MFKLKLDQILAVILILNVFSVYGAEKYKLEEAARKKRISEEITPYLPPVLEYIVIDYAVPSAEQVLEANKQLLNSGNIAEIKEALEKGADVDIKDLNGNTLLMDFSRNKTAVELLLDNGANVNLKNNAGYTALMNAVRVGKGDNIHIIKLLLDKGADVNATTPNGWNALMSAVYTNSKPAVEVLLEAGADVNAVTVSEYTGERKTAYQIARFHGYHDIADLLLIWQKIYSERGCE